MGSEQNKNETTTTTRAAGSNEEMPSEDLTTWVDHGSGAGADPAPRAIEPNSNRQNEFAPQGLELARERDRKHFR